MMVVISVVPADHPIAPFAASAEVDVSAVIDEKEGASRPLCDCNTAAEKLLLILLL